MPGSILIRWTAAPQAALLSLLRRVEVQVSWAPNEVRAPVDLAIFHPAFIVGRDGRIVRAVITVRRPEFAVQPNS